MKKTIIVAIIAFILVASIAGTCVALYKISATDKVVNITATSGQVCNLTLGNTGSLDFSGINPNNRTHTFRVTLDTDNSGYVDGVSGIFKVALTGEGTLKNYITVTVNEIASIDAVELGSENAAAITNSGATIALSAAPKYYQVTLYLSEGGVANFATIAEQTATVTVSWTVDDDSLFTYDSSAYYAVGTINGVTAWLPCSTSILLDDETTGENVAQKNAITLHEGDVFKVVRNYRDSAVWYSGQTSNSSVSGVQVNDDYDKNIQITADGTYYIFVNGSGQVWVDTHA